MSDSRMDRLFKLIVDKQSPIAVTQLASLAATRLQPAGIHALSQQLLKLQKSSEWAVRTIGSQAIYQVAVACKSNVQTKFGCIPSAQLKRIADFDICAILRKLSLNKGNRNKRKLGKLSAAEQAPLVDADGAWCFAALFCNLRKILLSAHWEVRHGAAIGLRELVLARRDDVALSSAPIVSDLLYRLLAVLAADRFTDFEGDRVVGPVRTACGTLLGAVMTLASDAVKCAFFGALEQFFAVREQTHAAFVRNAGCVALRFACMAGVPAAELARVLRLARMGMADRDEDVRVEALETLCSLLEAGLLDAGQRAELRDATWALLCSQRHDSLDTSVGSVLRLLARLHRIDSTPVSRSLRQLIDGVCPFLWHNVISVRLATLQLLEHVSVAPHQAVPLQRQLLQYALQSVYLATTDELADAATALVSRLATTMAANAALVDDALVRRWLALLRVENGQPVPESLLEMPAVDRLAADDDDDLMVVRGTPVVLADAGVPSAVRFVRRVQTADALAPWLKHAPLASLTAGAPETASAVRAVALLGAAWSARRLTEAEIMWFVNARTRHAADVLTRLLIERALVRRAAYPAQDLTAYHLLASVLQSASTAAIRRVAARELAHHIVHFQSEEQRRAAMSALCAPLAALASSKQATRLSAAYLSAAYEPQNDEDDDSNDDSNEDAKQRNGYCVAAQIAVACVASQESFDVAATFGRPLKAPGDLGLLSAMVPFVDTDKHSALVAQQVDRLVAMLAQADEAMRHGAALCVADACAAATQHVASTVVRRLVALLRTDADARIVANAVAAVRHVLRRMGDRAAMLVAFFVAPMLVLMSSVDVLVRDQAAPCFATLVSLMPIENALESNTLAERCFSADELRARDSKRAMITQLLDGSKLEHYEMPAALQAGLIKCERKLRPYQQEGVNWLAFLRRYGLHGILCDEMGLGKTLQTLCIVATDRYEHEQFYKSGAGGAGDNDALLFDGGLRPSIIVCPVSLRQHWVNECNRFFGSTLRAAIYGGSKSERARVLRSVSSQSTPHNVLVASYATVRSDRDALSKVKWRYAVLDEGHIIKNHKSIASQAIKMLDARFRVLLSGTPVQNHVLELWSLFDFLMPGFLGTASAFNKQFSKPIAALGNNKASAAQTQRAERALTKLHRQVLPFILRRLKRDVLHELPAKIIQDVECEMSALQRAVTRHIENGGNDLGARLRLLKVCNHPSLLANDGDAQIRALLAAASPKVDDVAHSGKLTALLDLLQTCGISSLKQTDGASGDSAPLGAHRALIFTESPHTLTLVENAIRSSCTFLRIDSAVEAARRQPLVDRFQNDPTIDLMLLTKSAGALGLTLTAADVVIMYDHNWNPQVDLQAMDRTHRLGQKRVVNVYRLITRDTIEQRQMSLQEFKLKVADAVVNEDNSNVAHDLDTNQVLNVLDDQPNDDDDDDDNDDNNNNNNNKSSERARKKAKISDDAIEQQAASSTIKVNHSKQYTEQENALKHRI